MEVIQMESTVYKELMEKIDGIAAYVRKSEKRMSEENAEILLDNEQCYRCRSNPIFIIPF